MVLPEFGLPQDALASFFRRIERGRKAADEPHQPFRDVEVALLSLFEGSVISRSLAAYGACQAVKALRRTFRPRQAHIGERSRDATIAVLEGMDGHEPEMRDRG